MLLAAVQLAFAQLAEPKMGDLFVAFQLASPAELDEAGTGLPLALPHLGQHRTHPKHDCLQPLQTYLQCPRSALVAVVTSEAFGWLPQPP